MIFNKYLGIFTSSLVVFIILGVTFIFPVAKAGTPYNPNRLMDDLIFDNSTSMTPSQIDNWLNNFPSSCISTKNGFSAPDPTGYSPTTGYTYGSNVSAGTVIAHAAQAYNLNPQVMLATLQKEQGLVTGGAGCHPNSPDPNAPFASSPGPNNTFTCDINGSTTCTYACVYAGGCMNIAIGNDCPGYCKASSEGFSKQVIEGTWKLKYWEQRTEGNVNWNIQKPGWNNSDDPPSCYTGPMTQGNRARSASSSPCPYSGPPGTTLSYYDGYTTIDNGSTSVHLDTGATAALYRFTPFSSGASSFVDKFTSWFGPTTGTKILNAPGNATFYVFSAGQKIPIPTQALYYAYGFNKIATNVVSQAFLDSLPTGPNLTNLSRYSSNGAIELIDNGNRYNVSSLTTCSDWALSCSDPSVVNTLDDDLFSTTTWLGYLQPLMYNNGTIYKMSSGNKLPFLNLAAMTQNGYNYGQVSIVTSANASQPLGPLLPSANTAFRLSNGQLMVNAGGQNIAVNSLDMFYRWGLDSAYYSSLPASSWDVQPPAIDGTLSDGYIGFGNTKILVDGGHKLDVSAASTDWPTAPNASAYMGTLLNRLPMFSINSSSCLRTNNGDIIRVENGQRRSIRLVADLYLLGCQASTLISVNESSLSILAMGPAKLTANRLFQKAGAPSIYMETGAAGSVALPSYDYVSAFGQYPSDIALVDDATLTNYAPTGSISSVAGNASSATYFLYSPDGTKYYFTSSTFSAWGINKQTTPTYDNKIGAINTPRPATQFARTSDGSIYYASGGTRHLLRSWGAFTRLGGTPDNTMNVLNDFIAVVPAGSDIN